MVGRVEGRVCLVTGAARGLGASYAELLARHGGRVLLCDVRDDEGQQVASDIREAGGQANYAHLDVRDSEQWAAAVAMVVAEFGRLDVLVNNAGIDSPPGLLEETEEHFRLVVEINQIGVFLGMKAAAKELSKSVGGGSIINIASVSGIAGSEGFIAYHASKGAVRLMTKSAAHALGASGIRVNAICPGIVPTALVLEHETMDDVYASPWVMRTALGRPGTPEDIAHAVLYLASTDSAYVTGSDLVVDGGFLHT